MVFIIKFMVIMVIITKFMIFIIIIIIVVVFKGLFLKFYFNQYFIKWDYKDY